MPRSSLIPLSSRQSENSSRPGNQKALEAMLRLFGLDRLSALTSRFVLPACSVLRHNPEVGLGQPVAKQKHIEGRHRIRYRDSTMGPLEPLQCFLGLPEISIGDLIIRLLRRDP